MPNVTYLVDDTLVTAREAEVPNADFTGGANAAASNACGIGINMNVPQSSQTIGGDAAYLRVGTVSSTGDGVVTSAGNAELDSLAEGWIDSEPA